MVEGFADSTIDATIWLLAWHPERVKAWLDRHPPGAVLERLARDQMRNPPEARYG
jgi:hypothetical protein